MVQWGYIDDRSESLQSKGVAVKFGLNQGARISALNYVPQSADSNEYVQMEITLADGAVMKQRIYMPSGDVYSGNNRLSPGMEGYDKAVQEQTNQRLAVLIHAVRALGATPEQIQNNLNATKPQSFQQWCQAVLGGVSQQLLQSNRVDVFLEYEWNIREGQTQTYLVLPRNMKGGYWLCQAMPGTFKEENTADGLSYVNEQGMLHPFTRSVNFMESNKAKQQKADGANRGAATSQGTAAAAAPQGSSTVSTW